MTLAPLLDASPIIRFHAAFAFAAIGLGAVQLLAPKGTLPHRTIGWAWALLMILVAGTSLFIHTIRTWGPWSPSTFCRCSRSESFPSPSSGPASTMSGLIVRR
jgi:uncharacterized membrane protein